MKEKCGVAGIYLRPSEHEVFQAARLAYFALYSLQHRGQESAGIAVADGVRIDARKGMGLVAEVFNEEDLRSLTGHIACAHALYSTSGAATADHIQPFVIRSKLGGIALAHNGNLVNYEQLKEFLEETGSTFLSHSDTEVIVKLIAKSYKKGLERALTDTIQMIKGSFALVVMTENALIGARDPNGIRPLCLGKLHNGWMLASESCAVDAVGGEFVRDISPGEIVIINDDGVLSFEFGERTAKRTCIFEYVYFARPDSVLDTIPVQEARLRMGAVLARENPVDADVVLGVPDSGLGAAMGYSAASGIPYVMGIVKNKYIGRTFIAPTQDTREKMVFVKHNALKSDVAGKRVIIIDDSIVRGTTCKRLVQVLRNAGAREVHFRISSPPVRFPCYFGIDTPCRAELISSAHTEAEVRDEIGADSLAFISIDGMFEALRSISPKTYGYCKGCFTGEYPIPFPGELNGRRL
ncbi:MAG: amidophosphoribosyltransferase [Spirochaetaceae bacterium]|jgi:amidophosphoribosyltransferase|nr:amidophosphoribosyltransferase [Spirochaetaceae bacterium]